MNLFLNRPKMAKVDLYEFCIEYKWSNFIRNKTNLAEQTWPNDLYLPSKFKMDKISYENTSQKKTLENFISIWISLSINWDLTTVNTKS